MLIGPTGCGKTLLAQTLARILDVPFTIADATNLTEAGYVGEDVENVLVGLLHAAEWNIDRAKIGIVYVDEIDKIARKQGDNPSITRDVSGEGVQQACSRCWKATVINVPPQGGRKHPTQEYIQLDTSNILFICGGAFAGLDETIGRRVQGPGRIGFGAGSAKRPDPEQQKAELLRQVISDDLMKFGLIPEFVGRLPVAVSVDPLDKPASGAHSHRAAQRPGQAVPAALRHRQRGIGLHPRIAAGRGRRGHQAAHRRARPAHHPRIGAAGRDVRDPVAPRGDQVRGQRRHDPAPQPAGAAGRRRAGRALEPELQETA